MSVHKVITLLIPFAIVSCHDISGPKMTRNNVDSSIYYPPLFNASLKRFPRDFFFGVASSAYQIEGAWNVDGKSESIWDRLTHTRPNLILDGSNGDIAADSYNKIEEDVRLLKEMKVDHYRFSLAWTRILPTGFSNFINPLGVEYYRKLINALRRNGIEPMVTIYHWDLPQSLQDLGGWTNRLSVEWFVEYARICFQIFGKSVKYWFTFNEPKQICHYAYGDVLLAPAIISPEGEYLCAHHVLLAHAAAWQLYRKKFRSIQKGKVGFVFDTFDYLPLTNSKDDQEAAETAYQFTAGWFANPLIYGDYPQVMKEKLFRRSLAAGYRTSILPTFTNAERTLLKGSVDFFGLNIYSAFLATKSRVRTDSLLWNASMEVDLTQSSEWADTSSDLFKVTPFAMRGVVRWVTKAYKGIPIIITENGLSDNSTTLEDYNRIDFIRENLASLRESMILDHANVFGYTHWTFLDCFEWPSGYTQKFGLIQIDYNSPDRTRTPKISSDYYRKVCSTKCIYDDCQ